MKRRTPSDVSTFHFQFDALQSLTVRRVRRRVRRWHSDAGVGCAEPAPTSFRADAASLAACARC
jgi:hypothetical protein